ncbi:MAG: ABC transporter substrate-binding protein [Candidatus Thorarchaeota archaeon]|jgi:ABC-type transport system substrate-binding protein
MRNPKLAIIVMAIAILLVNTTQFPSAAVFVEDENTGPFVDKLLYKVISAQDQEVLALLNDEIDLMGTQVDPVYLPQLEANSDINTVGVLRNGYGELVINTVKYPLNVTAFRRALAFALNKTLIVEDTWSGEAFALDSPVPAVNPWSIEGLLPYNYYASESLIGNQLLDDAGFADIDADGFREAPDGSDFDVLIEVAQSSNVAIDVGAKVAAALASLSIDAQSQPTDFFDYLTRVNLHGDFDMVFMGRTFYQFGIQWLETNFGSAYASVDYFNPSNFQNATFDAWLPQLLYSTAYSDVREAAEELQKILIYQCPVIILYENINYAAYRTDTFENHVSDVLENVPSFWTNLKVRKKVSQGSPYGGTFRISNALDVDSFNFMVSSSANTATVLKNTQLSLMKMASNGLLTPWLAESYLIETNADNSSIPIGHTRFTYDILQNATWSDGHPVDASDVAYSINYYRDSVAYGNPTGAGLSDVAAAYGTSSSQVVIEFSTESYWHIDAIATLNIIPQHIFTTIGLSGWNSWNPIMSSDPLVTASPFNVTEYLSGEYVELSYCEDFFFAPTHPPPFVDNTDPVVIGPLIVAFPESSTGYEISWNLNDDYPDSYEIYKDGTLYRSGPWNATSENVTISLDGLSAGFFEFILIAEDTSGNTGSWSVLVMVMDIVPPVLTHPSDFEFVNGTTGNIVSWNATDENPLSYVVLVNGTETIGGFWNSSAETFEFNVDGLSPGSYNITIYVFDVSFNMASDTVWVTAHEPAANGFDSLFQFLMDNLLIVSAAGVIIVVLIVVIGRRGRG